MSKTIPPQKQYFSKPEHNKSADDLFWEAVIGNQKITKEEYQKKSTKNYIENIQKPLAEKQKEIIQDKDYLQWLGRAITPVGEEGLHTVAPILPTLVGGAGLLKGALKVAPTVLSALSPSSYFNVLGSKIGLNTAEAALYGQLADHALYTAPALTRTILNFNNPDYTNKQRFWDALAITAPILNTKALKNTNLLYNQSNTVQGNNFNSILDTDKSKLFDKIYNSIDRDKYGLVDLVEKTGSGSVRNHSLNVTKSAEELAKKMFPNDIQKQNEAVFGALVHDFGKYMIGDHVNHGHNSIQIVDDFLKQYPQYKKYWTPSVKKAVYEHMSDRARGIDLSTTEAQEYNKMLRTLMGSDIARGNKDPLRFLQQYSTPNAQGFDTGRHLKLTEDKDISLKAIIEDIENKVNPVLIKEGYDPITTKGKTKEQIIRDFNTAFNNRRTFVRGITTNNDINNLPKEIKDDVIKHYGKLTQETYNRYQVEYTSKVPTGHGRNGLYPIGNNGNYTHYKNNYSTAIEPTKDYKIFPETSDAVYATTDPQYSIDYIHRLPNESNPKAFKIRLSGTDYIGENQGLPSEFWFNNDYDILLSRNTKSYIPKILPSIKSEKSIILKKPDLLYSREYPQFSLDRTFGVPYTLQTGKSLKESLPFWQKFMYDKATSSYNRYFGNYMYKKLFNKFDRNNLLTRFDSESFQKPNTDALILQTTGTDISFGLKDLKDMRKYKDIQIGVTANKGTKVFDYVNDPEMSINKIAHPYFAYGGDLNNNSNKSTNSRWNELDLKSKSSLIQMAVRNGVYNIEDIRNMYDSLGQNTPTNINVTSNNGVKYADGGPIGKSSDDNYNDYFEWLQLLADKKSKEWNEPYSYILMDMLNNNEYDYKAFYDENPQRAWDYLNSEEGTHFDDVGKTVYHPSFSNESAYSANNYGDMDTGANPNDIVGPAWNDNNQLIDSDGNVVFDENRYAKGGLIRTFR